MKETIGLSCTTYSKKLKFMEKNSLNIAIIGSGVAGLSASYFLNKKHNVTLFEKSNRLGGHTRTIEITDGRDKGIGIDTGFIVMNLKNYPIFSKLLKQLNVPIQKSCMTFSYSDFNNGYAYSGTSIRGLFPSTKYLFNLEHFSLLGDLIRLAIIGSKDLKSNNLDNITIGDYLDEKRFSPIFQNRYLFPMGAAIWSSPILKMREFPAKPYLKFLDNHGLLKMINQPQWYTVKGGSYNYIKSIVKKLKNAPRVSQKIKRIIRDKGLIKIEHSCGKIEVFDKVIVATHADDALKLLADPSEIEKKMLAPWEYQINKTILHTYLKYLPERKFHRASWNFLREKKKGYSSDQSPVCVSYNMNRLQKIKSKTTYIVTLNPINKIPEKNIISEKEFRHPVYSFDSLKTQSTIRKHNGENNTWFCGSYCGYGFHEDAVKSSFEISKSLDPSIDLDA